MDRALPHLGKEVWRSQKSGGSAWIKFINWNQFATSF